MTQRHLALCSQARCQLYYHYRVGNDQCDTHRRPTTDLRVTPWVLHHQCWTTHADWLGFPLSEAISRRHSDVTACNHPCVISTGLKLRWPDSSSALLPLLASVSLFLLPEVTKLPMTGLVLRPVAVAPSPRLCCDSERGRLLQQLSYRRRSRF